MISFAPMRPGPAAGPWVGALAFAALAAWSIAALPALVFDHDTRSLLLEDAAADETEHRLAESFGSDDILLVAWPVPDLLRPEEFDLLRRVTQALAAIPGLDEAYSLASANVPLPLDRLRPITRDDLADPVRREQVRSALLAAPVYLGTLYSPALDVVAVATTVRHTAPRTEREATVRAVREAAEGLAPEGRPVYVAGVSALAMDANRHAIDDLKRVGSLALAASVLTLLALRRSVVQTAIAVAATALPPLYALGLAAAFGHPVTALAAALFPVLGVVGITSSIYLLDEYGARRRRGAEGRAAAFGAARCVAAPVVLSLVTTGAGFLTLRFTGVPAFRAAGTIVGIGVMAAVPVVLFGLPCLLAIVAPRTRPRRRRAGFRPLLRLGAAALARPGPVLWVTAAACAVGMALTLRARVHVDVLQAFHPSTRVAKTYRFLDARLTATLPVDAVLEPREGTGIAAVLGDLEAFSRAAEAQPGVANALSLVSLVRYGASILGVRLDVIRESPALDAVLAILRTGFAQVTRRFEQVATGGAGARYRVKLRVREGTDPAVLDRLDEAAAAARTGPCRLTGLYVRAVDTARHLLGNVVRGAAVMLAFVVATVAVALRSWRAGLAAVLPNLVPPAIVFGGASLLGVPLDVSAVAVGAVAVGLAIDSTIHILFRAAAYRRCGHSARGMLLRALRSVGRPLALSTAVLCAGLGFLALSAFLPTARFGLLTAVTSVFALLGDLVALPAAARLLRAL